MTLTPLAQGQAAAAPAKYTPLQPQVEKSVSGVNVPAPTDSASRHALKSISDGSWPAAGTGVAGISHGVAARAGTLPVSISAPSAATVKVDLFDRFASEAEGRSVVMRLSRTDGGEPTTGRVSLDYSTFRNAYGGDWANRLRLVRLPECALTTPSAPQCQATPLASTNDVTTHTLSSAVTLSGVTLLAATSSPSGGAGDYTATALSPSSTWQAGGSSGDFSWNYPLRVPPSLGGPSPQLGLSYSAQSVDGHTAASNNQPSWVGEGFNFAPGSISRGYKACADDMGGTAINTTKTGDECWGTYNATLSMSGHGGELIRNDADGTYRLKNDDDTRVELLTGATNGDNNGEYWKITTKDGTQYFFGLNHLTGWTSGKATTNSAWTTPVYGNNPGEPCYNSTWTSAYCSQAWQWNLDYVVDVHGNTMSYWYTTETNNYARNNSDSSVSNYVRGGYLTRIDYGTDNRSGTDTEYTTTTAPMRVALTVGDRCIPGSTCDFAHPLNWPDTPLDLNCSSSTSCPGLYSPTFWTQKRLASVKTQVWGGSAYRDVEQWTLSHTYPDPGDGTRAGLWLDKISHAGLVGGSVSVPDVKFTGIQLQNRVDTNTDGTPAMNWWRLASITTESGGVIGISYSGKECVAGTNMPASPDNNLKRCFPVYWIRNGGSNPAIDWFHKYVVTAVTETDMTGGNPRVITSYSYATPTSPLWHYDGDDGLVPASRKSWGQWRGYSQVDTVKGDPGAQTLTRDRFFQGMNGDKTSTGTRTVNVDGIADDDAFAGMTRETMVFNGPGGAEVSGTVNTPWKSTPRATRTINGWTVYSRHTGVAVTVSRTDLDGGRAARASTVTNTFDDTYGYVTKVADNGDDGIATTDDKCTITTRVNNTTAWIIGLVVRSEIYGLPCGATVPSPSSEADVIADTKSYFDHLAWNSTPTKGEATETDIVKTWISPTNISYIPNSKTTYDAYGRVTDSYDVRNNHTVTAFTPAGGGPVTKVTTTNPLNWTSYADYEPAWGTATDSIDVNSRRTDFTFDPLGRLTAVWQPGRIKGQQTANATFAYSLSNTGVSYTTTSLLNAAGNYATKFDLYDSLLRPRQTQAPSATGSGRVLTDSFYDTAGRGVKANATYYNTDSPPSTTLFIANDAQIPTQVTNTFDGAGRVVISTLRSVGVEQSRTTTVYGGDHVDVTPPAGGTPTRTVSDVFGRTVSVSQFIGTTTSGTAYTSATAYDRRGNVAQRTDQTGLNKWTYTYDLLGRVVSLVDPDRTTDLTQPSTTNTYDDAGDVLTTTDVKRGTTLAYSYDALGRKTGEFDTSTSGTKLIGWAYDTAVLASDGVTPARGQLASATRYVNGNAYSNTVRGYTDTYQSVGNNIVIPGSEGALSGTYIFTNTYNINGSLNTHRYPAGGGLAAETVTAGYDVTSGLPITLATNYSGTTGYVTGTTYTPFSEPTVTTLSTGGKIAQRGVYYDTATRRVNEVVTAKETTPSTIADVKYGFDPAGNVIKIADVTSGDTQCFRSDSLQRLYAAWTPSSGDCATDPTSASSLGGPAPYWQSWTFFDQTGNRKTQVDHKTTGDVTTNYTYGTDGQAQPHRLISTNGGGTGSYGYDSAGDTNSRPGSHGQQTLNWDIEGHLGSLSDSAGGNSYVYDDTGNRLVSHDPTGATLYLPGMELRLTASTSTVSGTRYYQHNGQPIAQRTAAGVTWLAADVHGTQMMAIDSVSQAVTLRRQTPFGTSRGTPVTWANPHGFVDGIDDPTGLTHVGAREYEPSTGRFMSVDPVFNAEHPQTWNGYAYANNSPITASDPTGLDPDQRGPCGAYAGGHCPSAPGQTKMCPCPPSGSSGGTPSSSPWSKVITSPCKALFCSVIDPNLVGPAPSIRASCRQFASGSYWSSPAECEAAWSQHDAQVNANYEAADKANDTVKEHCAKTMCRNGDGGPGIHLVCGGFWEYSCHWEANDVPDPTPNSYHSCGSGTQYSASSGGCVDVVVTTVTTTTTTSTPKHGASPTGGVTFCVVLCFGISGTTGGSWFSVGCCGVGGWGVGAGANTATGDDQSAWSFQACAGVYAGGCVQGGATTGGPDPMWVGGQVTGGTGVFIGANYNIKLDWGHCHILCG